MENPSQRKARLIVDVSAQGAVVGTDEPVNLEFEDCITAVNGLVNWLARALAETGEDVDPEEIGSAILIDALHHWTFDEHVESEEDADEMPEEEPETGDE